jgi:hypothetical protein
MRAPPDENEDLHFGSDPDDSDEDVSALPPSLGLPGGFPDRSETASTAYY